MRYMPVMILASGLAALAAPALAQDADTLQTAPEDCAVAPAPEAAPDTDTGMGAGTGDEADDTLSDVLDPCNGVLAPAPVGDQDMTIDPPALGRTPVIEPGELPPQPADGE